MGDLKPIGSEKLTGNEKMKRILDLTYYNRENKSSNHSNSEYITESNNGFYGIVKEKDGYYVKKGINESSLDYIGGMFMKNKNRFSSYGEALKRLELLKGQEILEEEKKYILKVNNTKPTESVPAEPEIDKTSNAGAPSLPPEGLGGEMGSTEPTGDELPGSDGTEMPDMGNDSEMGGEDLSGTDDSNQDSPDEESSPLKSVEKLTGRLGQKLRDAEENLESKDIKYVLNSIISAVNLDKLDDDDAEDVRSKLDNSDSEEDFGSEESMDTETPPDETNPEGMEDDLGETMDALENLTNTEFDTDQDENGDEEYGQTKQLGHEPCSWCGYRYGHAVGCPEKENNTETNEFDIDEQNDDNFSDNFTFDKEDEDEIDIPMDNPGDFDYNEDASYADDWPEDADDFKQDNWEPDDEEESTSKEIEISELTDMINNSVKQTLGSYFE